MFPVSFVSACVCRDAKALQEKAAKKAAQAVGGNNIGGMGKKK